MEATNLLVNLALLESLKGTKRTDELDLYLPYIALTVCKIDKDSFDETDVKAKLIEAFNFAPPTAALQVLLTRAKRRGLIKLNNHKYFKVPEKLNKILEGAREKELEINRSLDSLFVSFSKYALDNFDQALNRAEADFFLYDFISKNISTFVGVLNGFKFTVESKIKNKDYLTACFIKNLHDDESTRLRDLDIVVKGTILANYLSYADKTSSKRTFENISIYLDGPLVLGLLGFNGTASERSLNEFLDLVKYLCVSARIFDVTFDEVESILNAWKIDLEKGRFDKFRPKTIELLRSKGIDAIRLDTEIVLLKNKIENLGIVIEDNFKPVHEHYCDIAELENTISSTGLNHDLRHDITCLSRVHNTRNDSSITSFDKSFSVFVTLNDRLEFGANKFFDPQFKANSIPIVTSDRWMATVLWLKRPDAFANIPSNILLANSYSIIYADDKFWSGFITRLNNLKKCGSMSEEDFTLVRWDRSLIERIHNVSVETGVDFKDEDVFDVLESIKAKNIEEKELELRKMEIIKNKEICSMARDKVRIKRILDVKTKRITNLAINISHGLSLILCAVVLSLIIIGLIISLPDIPYLVDGKPNVESWWAPIVILSLLLMTFGNLVFGATVRGLYTSTQEKVRLIIECYFDADIAD